MTLSRGFRGDAGRFRQTAAHIVAAALVVTAMFAALWAGPAASASASRSQSPAASPPTKRVRYYIVPQPRKGPAVTLYGIAARTLGDTHRYIEIFNLNKGRLQPNGRRLENPNTIDPGWILQLPADASGPGVHFGRLPAVTPSTTSPASHRPSRQAAGGAAPHSLLRSTGTGSAVVVGGALVLLATAGLAVALSRRWAGAAARRKPSHTKTKAPGPRDSVRTGAVVAVAPDIRATDPRWPVGDHPSLPGGVRPSIPGADHPSFPGADHPILPGGDHPSFPGADPRLPGGDHPSFPGADHPRWPSPDPSWPRAVSRSTGPRRESPPGPRYDQRSPAASRPAAAGVRNPPGNWGSPGAPPGDVPDRTRRWPAQVGKIGGAAIQTYQDVASGDSPFQVVLTHPPAAGWERATGLGARAEDMLQFSRGQRAQLVDPLRRQAGEFRDVQSLWLAGRILSGAEDQAAEIRYEARDQAAAMRATAEQEAAEIRQQAAAARATAEQEAAEIRAAAMTMSAELGRVAAYVTESLASPSMPATKPDAWPAIKPATHPGAKPDGRPGVKPGSRPTAKPATRPAAKPDAQPGTKPGTRRRQYAALRLARIAIAAMFLFAVIAGTTEVALHGFKFFVFRSAGTGSTPDSGLKEDQGPGQPNAPGAHHQLNKHKP